MLMFPFAITDLVKILKKYDKRTGVLIRLFIQNALLQPFFNTVRGYARPARTILSKPSVSNEQGTKDINTKTSL
jgi:hypothetical protein